MHIAVCTSILVLLLAPSAAAQTNGTPEAPAPPPATDSDYRLTAGDKLRIEVYKDDQLSQSLQIRPDGKITLPYVGDIPAAGLTPIQLRDRIIKDLQPFIANPTVTVIVTEATPRTIYITGEVNSPGPQPIRGPLTVLQALAMAGGFKDFANTKNIVIRRITPDGVKDLKFNYKQAIKGETKPIYLEPGDTIIVP